VYGRCEALTLLSWSTPDFFEAQAAIITVQEMSKTSGFNIPEFPFVETQATGRQRPSS
jgi:hypothetical protein